MKISTVRRRILLSGALLVTTGILAAGCSAPAAPPVAVVDPGQERLDQAKKEGSIVWYSGFNEDTSNKFADGFKAETGIDVDVVRLGGEELFSRVESEASVGAGGADVVTTGDAAHFVQFEADGLLTKFSSLYDKDIDAQFKDPNGYYYVPYMLRFGIGYNTNVVKGSDIPKTWADLVKTGKWDNQLVTSNPAFSVGAAAVPYFWDQKLKSGYIDQVAALHPQVFQAVADALAPVETGEKAISLTAPYYLIRNAQADGSPVDTVFASDGVPVTLAGTGILKSAEHPNAAAAFTDYLMSPEGQQVFADDNRDVGNANVTYGKGYIPLSDIQDLIYVIDPSDFAKDIDRIRAEFTEKFGV